MSDPSELIASSQVPLSCGHQTSEVPEFVATWKELESLFASRPVMLRIGVFLLIRTLTTVNDDDGPPATWR